MNDLVRENSEASAWMDRAKAAYSGSSEFGRLASAVVWVDTLGADGKQLVAIDPLNIVADINMNGWPLLIAHDPGRPAGRVLRAEIFHEPDGLKFVAALIGLYEGKNTLTFDDLGIETSPFAKSPLILPPLPDSAWIEFQFSPRKIDYAWIKDVLETAPLRVEQALLSFNTAESISEFIGIGLLYTALVWNPFIASIATEAGKDTYAALRNWLRRLLLKLADLNNPILIIQSHHNQCNVSFIFRGNDVKKLYLAHDALPLAAARATTLIENMKKMDAAPRKIVYEFKADDELWVPSFAELHDDRFIVDNKSLISAERLPSGLSLGINFGRTTST